MEGLEGLADRVEVVGFGRCGVLDVGDAGLAIEPSVELVISGLPVQAFQ